MKLPLEIGILFLSALLVGCTQEAKVGRKMESALKHYAADDFAAAEIELKNVLALEPRNPEALKTLGIILVRQGIPYEGGRTLSVARSLLPKDTEIRYHLATALLSLGDVPNGRKEIDELLALDPGHGRGLMLLAEISRTPAELDECAAKLEAAAGTATPERLLAEALVELRRGRKVRGGELLEEALARDSGLAGGHALRSAIRQAENDTEGALEAMKAAAEKGGPRSPESISYAALLIGRDRPDEARAHLESQAAAAPDFLPTFRLLAVLAGNRGDLEEAHRHLAKVLEKSPQDVEAALLRTELWLREGKAEEAVALMETITRSFPSSPLLETSLATAYLAAGQEDKAAARLEPVVAADPHAAGAVVMRSRVHLQQGEAEKAVAALEKLLEAKPESPVARDLLVDALVMAGRVDDAVAILEQRLEENESPALRLRLGQLLRASGRTAEARTALERAGTALSDNLATIAQLALIDFQEGRREEAMARIDAYLESEPESAAGLLLKAGLLHSAGDKAGAEALGRRAIASQPDHPQATAMVVAILVEDRRSEEAIQCLRAFLEKVPDHVAARLQLGGLLMETGRSGEARGVFEDLIRLAPDSAPAHNNLACIIAEEPGRLEEAIGHASAARNLEPDNPAILDTLGWLEWRSGDFPEALSLLRLAASGLPGNPEVQYHLAMAHYMMDQRAEAAEALRRAVQGGSALPWREEANQRLSWLDGLATMDQAALQEIAGRQADEIPLLVELAERLMDAGEPARALETFDKALAVNPSLETAQVGKAWCFVAMDDLEKAAAAAEEARRIAAESPRAAAALGAIEFRRGRQERAYALLAEAAPKLPEEPAIQHEMARAAYSQGRVSEARQWMESLAESPSHRTEAEQFLLLTDDTSDEAAGLAGLVEARLAADARDAPALVARARLARASGADPEKDLRAVLEIYPEFDPARIDLARHFLDRHERPDEAEALLEKARERLADDSAATALLGIAAQRQGKFERAEALLEEAAARRPLAADELCALGLAQAALGRSEARETLGKALAAGLPDPDVAAVRKAIEQSDGSRADNPER